MRCAVQIAVAAFAFLTLGAGHAEDGGHPEHAGAKTAHSCLNQKERRSEMEADHIVRLAAAMRVAKAKMPGAVVRARLCHGADGLVYMLTVLAHDGKVRLITVDAAKGTLVGGR